MFLGCMNGFHRVCLQVGGREDYYCTVCNVCLFSDRLGGTYERWGQGWQAGQLGVCFNLYLSVLVVACNIKLHIAAAVSLCSVTFSRW